MFVPILTYDPDFFEPNVFVLSMQEISIASQPLKKTTGEGLSQTQMQRVSSVDQVSMALLYVWTQIRAQRVNNDPQIGLASSPYAATQIQSKFETRTFGSKLAAPSEYAPLVSGEFVTSQTVVPLYDNIVFRVTVGALDLSDTKANNKSVAPVVS